MLPWQLPLVDSTARCHPDDKGLPDRPGARQTEGARMNATAFAFAASALCGLLLAAAVPAAAGNTPSVSPLPPGIDILGLQPGQTLDASAAALRQNGFEKVTQEVVSPGSVMRLRAEKKDEYIVVDFQALADIGYGPVSTGISRFVRFTKGNYISEEMFREGVLDRYGKTIAYNTIPSSLVATFRDGRLEDRRYATGEMLRCFARFDKGKCFPVYLRVAFSEATPGVLQGVEFSINDKEFEQQFYDYRADAKVLKQERAKEDAKQSPLPRM